MPTVNVSKCHSKCLKRRPNQVTNLSKRRDKDQAAWLHEVKLDRLPWALTKEEMNNCVWLKPKLVAQIEFTEWTPDGHLRHSKFVGLRDDKEVREVVRER
jgi:ATP-dependent DNA ligase